VNTIVKKVLRRFGPKPCVGINLNIFPPFSRFELRSYNVLDLDSVFSLQLCPHGTQFCLKIR